MIRKYRSVVLAGFLLFSAGCGNDQYSAERQYWLAQKNADTIFDNPYASPPRQLERAVEIFNKFASSHPGTALAAGADLTIARLYMVKEEYVKAIQKLNEIMKKYRDADEVYAEALFMNGYAYQAQEKWELALQEYNKLIRESPFSLRGLVMPLYIAQYYKIKYQPDKMITALKEAIIYYRGLAQKYSVTLPNRYIAIAEKMLQDAGVK